MENNKIDNNLLFLTEDNDAKALYTELISGVSKAIADVFTNEKAYIGLSPQELKQKIHVNELLPKQGLGLESVEKLLNEKLLPFFLRTPSTDYMAHLHGPALIETVAAELVLSTFNQSMDSWDQSPVATEIELEVIDTLCKLYGYGPTVLHDETILDKVHPDGVFTSGGSQSNLMALMLARDWYCNTKLNYDVKKLGLPQCYGKFRIYTSEISHFSMEKSAHLLGLGYNAVVKVPVDSKQKMDIVAFKSLVEQDIAQGNIPFCAVATVGTTDYGSIDDIQQMNAICAEHGMWLHADAAYGSGVIMSSKYKDIIGPIHMCDSITIDFHKMFLMPVSCGAFLLKDASNFEALTLHADYLNREEDEEDGYTNLVGKSMQTTRRFDALKVWLSFQVRGQQGWDKIITTCIDNAQYLYKKITSSSSFETVTKPEISSVVFRFIPKLNRDSEEYVNELNKKIRRKLIHDKGIVIGQTVYGHKVFLKFTLLNPRMTHEKLDSLLELISTIGSE